MGRDGVSVTEHQILIASKSKLIRFKLIQAFTERDFLVRETVSAPDTLSEILKNNVSVVLLGEQLSEMDAPQFLENLQYLGMDTRPKIIQITTDHDREERYRELGVDDFLYPPLMPEMAFLKVRTLLEPEVNLAVEREQVHKELRRYKRLPVKDLGLTFYTPVRELTEAVEISYTGLRARTCKMNELHVGATFKMQLMFRGEATVVNGRVMWIRDGFAGIRFSIPRPAQFQGFFDDVTAHAILSEHAHDAPLVG